MSSGVAFLSHGPHPHEMAKAIAPTPQLDQFPVELLESAGG
jgi:hypothetical protein